MTVGQASENNGVPAGGTISVTFPAGTTFSGANDPIGWVITSTLLGTVGTSAVSVSGTTVTFTVDQPIPAGSGFSITKGFAGPAITFGEASGDVLVQAGIDSGTGTLTLVGLTLTPQWPTIVASELLTGQTETAITITMPTGGILGSPDSMDEITIVTSNGTLVAGPLAPGDLVATWLTSGPAASIEGALPGGEANWHGHVNVTLYASNTPGIATISIYRGSILLGSTTVEFLANGAPEGDDVEATTPAGTPVTIDVLGGVTDPEGDPFTVESVTEPANGEVVDFGDGTFGYIPNAGFAGTDTFTVTVVDLYGGTLAVTVTVQVNNNAPVGADVSTSTPQDTPVTIDILAGVTDPDGDDIEVTSVTQGANGSVAIVDGEVVYTPNAGFSGTDTFTVTVTDENGGTLVITVTVAVNGNPVGADVSTSTQQDTPVSIDILAGVTDPDGDDIELTSVTQGSNGSVAIVGGEVVYTPNPGFAGTDTFTVTVTDENGGTLVITVTVTVNGNPVGDDVEASTPAGTPVEIDILGGVTDPNGDEVEVSAVTQGANGTVTIDGGNVVYTPAPGFAGTDTFTVTVTDENGGTLVLTVTVEVTNGNPVGADVSTSTQQDTPVAIDILAGVTDPDGDDIELTSVTQGSNGSVAIVDGEVVYTPNPGFAGTDTFTVTVTDENGGTLVITVTVTVNGAPTADDAEASTQAGTPVAIDVLDGASDPNGDDLEVESVTQGANGSVTIDGGNVVYTPAPGFSGTDSFDVTIGDGNGGTVTITVAVTVNGSPVGSDASASTQQDTPVTIDILGGVTDPDGDAMEISAVTQGTNGSVTISGGNVVYTPNAGFSGTDTFTVTITDENGGSLTITVTVTVNGAPAGDDIETTTPAGTPVEIDVLGEVSDPDGDTLTIDGVSNPSNGTATVAGGSVTYTPASGFTGTDSFNVTVSDGNGGSATLAVTVTVQGAQRILIAQNACVALKVMPFAATYKNVFWLMGPDGPRSLGLNNQNVGQQVTVGYYVAGTELVFAIKVSQTGYTFVTGPASGNPDNLVHAEVTPGTGNVLYVVGFEDIYGGGDLDFNDAVFQLLSIPCAINAGNDTAASNGSAVTVDVLDNDTATAAPLTVTAVTQPANGTVTTDGETVTFTPNTGASGTATFTYTVTDAAGNTDTATVTVTIAAAFEAVDDAAVTPKNSAITMDVLANDSGTGLTLVSVTQPGPGNSKGTVSIVGGQVKYTPRNNFTGTVTFTYTVKNSANQTDTATVTVTVGAPTSGGTGTGRMTGGGYVTAGNGKATFGLSLRCNGSGNNFQFNDHSTGVKFHLTSITSVTCSDNPSINPKPRPASIDTMVLKGTGRLGGNGPTATVELTITDQGEPGRNDTITVTVRNASGTIISQVSGKLVGGNIQAHH